MVEYWYASAAHAGAAASATSASAHARQIMRRTMQGSNCGGFEACICVTGSSPAMTDLAVNGAQLWWKVQPRTSIARRYCSIEARRLAQIELRHLGAVFFHFRAVEREIGLRVGRHQR